MKSIAFGESKYNLGTDFRRIRETCLAPSRVPGPCQRRRHYARVCVQGIQGLRGSHCRPVRWRRTDAWRAWPASQRQRGLDSIPAPGARPGPAWQCSPVVFGFIRREPESRRVRGELALGRGWPRRGTESFCIPARPAVARCGALAGPIGRPLVRGAGAGRPAMRPVRLWCGVTPYGTGGGRPAGADRPLAAPLGPARLHQALLPIDRLFTHQE